MVVYHGTNHHFKKLKISNKLSSPESLQNEGKGIYFSDDSNVATYYGKTVYEIVITPLDFRKITVCRQFIKKLVSYVKTNTKVDIYPYIEDIATQIYNNNCCVANLSENIVLVLDNNQKYYEEHTITKQKQVNSYIKKYCKTNIKAYFFGGKSSKIGVIKDLSSIESVTKITEKIN